MARRLTRTIRFDPHKVRVHEGIALIYDLEGFSRFFNQPDVQHYVPDFLNHINEAISNVFSGENVYWLEKDQHPGPLLHPVHEKFLGDGALYVWTPLAKEKTFSDSFALSLSNRLWNLKSNFGKVIREAADKVPVVELPPRIRFGLARGTVYELTNQGTRREEYIGFCINLASRLQKYCADLGFIASARTRIPEAKLQEHGYIKVVATNLRGFPNEIVIVDEEEYNNLDEEIRGKLFRELD
jgi:class 3 adenylate cyclase